MTTLRELPAGLRLEHGAHQPPNGQFAACFLEAVAFRAGEDWSDAPACVSPVIAQFGRSWNDAMSDEDRQILTPYIDRVIGTAGTPEQEEQRAWMCTDWLVRECAPAWLRLAGLGEHAHTLEALAAVTDAASARTAGPSVRAAGDAARDAARDAAGAAAGDAAGDAARAAAWDAAGDAAWVGAAAGDAAWDAAWAAVWAAARAAARDALDPTVKALQKSALLLLDRMIDVTAKGDS